MTLVLLRLFLSVAACRTGGAQWHILITKFSHLACAVGLCLLRQASGL